MAGIFSKGKSSAAVAVTAGGILAELAASSSVRVRIREIGVFMESTAGGAVTVGLGRPGNTPVGGTADLLVAEDEVDTQAATCNLYTAGWSTAPTVPTAIYRKIVLPATVGAGIVWAWPPGEELQLGLTRNLGLLIWALAQGTAASQTCSVYARVVE